jgi:hypothetical protein
MLGKLFGFHDIEVSGKMHVATLQKNFEESFGTKIRVYKPTQDGKINTGKGSKPADAKSTLASNCPPTMKISDITIRKGHLVSEIEKAFAEKMGLGVQIMTPDGKDFAPNDMKLKDVADLPKK